MGGVPCASVLKPLYAWVAPRRLNSYARAAIVTSDNEATDTLIDACGGLTGALERIKERTGVNWQSANTWGQVLITPASLRQAYKALAKSPDPGATAALTLMQDVVPTQRFGIPTNVPMKSGWDLNPHNGELLTHAVTVHGFRVRVFTSSIPIPAPTQQRWRNLLATGGPEAVLVLHEQIAGPRLRACLRVSTTPPCG